MTRTYPCDGVCEHGFTGPGGAVEENAARGLDAQVRVDLGVPQRVLDQLPHVLQAVLDAPQVAVPDPRPLRNRPAQRRACSTTQCKGFRSIRVNPQS
jgi:hypothetical protein